jgi:hypothetical protein
MWAFEWHDTSKDLILKRGEPLFYCQFDSFVPSRTIKLIQAALLHRHSKAEFSPIHSNLSDNLGVRSTQFRKSIQNNYTCMNFIDLTLKMSCHQLIS